MTFKQCHLILQVVWLHSPQLLEIGFYQPTNFRQYIAGRRQVQNQNQYQSRNVNAGQEEVHQFGL